MVTQTREGKTLFLFYRPDAQQVVIAGDFNGWAPSFHMNRGRDGWWRSQIELAPGTYRFRYLADGDWFTDYAAFGVEPGPYGMNSVLKVDPAPLQVEAPQSVTTAEPATVELQSPALPSPPPSRQPQAAPEPRRPVRQEPRRDWSDEPVPAARVRRRPAVVAS